ncbi:MAG: hypothetical protein AAGI01_08200 [Myxococcota bacterium]
MKNKFKIAMVVAGAMVSGSAILWRKIFPLRAQTCPYCGSHDVYVLAQDDRHVLGCSCGACTSRWTYERQRPVKLTEEEWGALLERVRAT